jgi:predicted AlkP superfamily pyrophosphatase or phosphodiesterase
MSPADRVLFFVVDGMRPDAMIQANTPAIQQLMQRGAATLTAETVMPSITLPTHMSMFYGVLPEVHGVTSNEYQPMPGGQIPGIVEVVRKAGRSPAAFHTWDPLRDLSRPGALVYSSFIDIYGPDGENSDQAIAVLAADYIVQRQPDFTFIYLGMTDEVGHRSGWLSPQYQATIERADAAIGHVVERLASAGLLERSAILVTADHGGHEHAHGLDIPEDMTIPWVLAGAGVKKNYQITGPVRIYDTAPTIAHLLGLSIPKEWQGRPVMEALDL